MLPAARSPRQSLLPVFRGYLLSADDRIRSAVIESFLCRGAVSKDAIEKRFDIAFDEYFRDELVALEQLERDGLVEISRDRMVRATPAGLIFVRMVAQTFDAFRSRGVASRAV
jgi:oxygen-independent coproporphyrinogen-3 oxidase